MRSDPDGSSGHRSGAPGLHAAIIMDGNGRWAVKRGLPRGAGHRAGVEAIRRTAEAAPGLGITTLTLFAFASDNWKRPQIEVGGLMRLLRAYLRSETGRLARTGTRLTVFGRRDRLPSGLPEAIERAEAATRDGSKLSLRIAVDYSSRDAILAAAARLARESASEAAGTGGTQGTGCEGASREAFGRLLADRDDPAGAPRDVDLMIRTGGEKRLSDFLLWEAAYAELHFTDRMWPDFGEADLAAAVADYARRDRRYGGLTAVPVAA